MRKFTVGLLVGCLTLAAMAFGPHIARAMSVQENARPLVAPTQLTAKEKILARQAAYKKYNDAIKASNTAFTQAMQKAQADRKQAQATAKKILQDELNKINKGKPVLQVGEVTLRGPYSRSLLAALPDTGGTMFINTTDYGEVAIHLPGFIRCQAKEIYGPTQSGEQIEVHGYYDGNSISLCGSNTYYVSKVNVDPAHDVVCTLNLAAGLTLTVHDDKGNALDGATITTDPITDAFSMVPVNGVYSGLWEHSGTYRFTVTKDGYRPYSDTVTLTKDDCHVHGQTRTIVLQKM